MPLKIALAVLVVASCCANEARAQSRPVLGSTPVATPAQLEQERRFIGGVVDPQNTLDMIAGRPRVILLKEAPKRTQIADETVMVLKLLGPDGKQMLVMGQKPGITVLNLWFADPTAKSGEKILSYMVRVLPDPEEKARFAARLATLEGEVNRTFPNSTIRLMPVSDKVILSGQTHDIVETGTIRRVLK